MHAGLLHAAESQLTPLDDALSSEMRCRDASFASTGHEMNQFSGHSCDHKDSLSQRLPQQPAKHLSARMAALLQVQ